MHHIVERSGKLVQLTIFQTLEHGAHAGRQIDGAGQGSDASGLATGDPVAEGAGPVNRYDAPPARGETNGFPRAAKVVRVIGELSLLDKFGFSYVAILIIFFSSKFVQSKKGFSEVE